MTRPRFANRLASLICLVSTWGLVACRTSPGPADRSDIGAWMAFHQVAGASVAVIRDFKLAYVETHGVKSRVTGEPVTERTLFQAASISKSFAAVGVMSLVQEGRLSLDTDVNDYLVSWRVPTNQLQAIERVTLRRLLSHTAGTTVHGFRGYRVPELIPTLRQILDGAPPANSAPVRVTETPGRRWRYSGGGYQIVQQVLEDVTGTPYAEWMQKRVLAPLNMSHSSFVQPLPQELRRYAASGYYADGTPVPGGFHTYPEQAAAGLWTTSTDLARYLIELQRMLRGTSEKVLSGKSARELVHEVKHDYALGLAWRRIRGERYFWHAGANDGFRCAMIAHPTRGCGLVIMTNSDNGQPKLAEAVLEVIARRECWPGF